MDEPPLSPNLMANPSIINPYKTKEDYSHKAKGSRSTYIFAFVLSIFIYTFVFYIFNLSPSYLIGNNKFWFFIFNTLILIIAVDYRAFSSSSSSFKKNHDLPFYDEYVMRKNGCLPALHSQYSDHEFIKTCIPGEEIEDFQKSKRNSNKVVFDVPSPRILAATPPPQGERRFPILREKEPASPTAERRRPSTPKATSVRTMRPRWPVSSNSALKPSVDSSNNSVVKTFRRSKSEIIPKRVTFDESRNIIRKVEREEYEPLDQAAEWSSPYYRHREYANMSVEELNRRVEDFIDRFNKQIRLQGKIYSRIEEGEDN